MAQAENFIQDSDSANSLFPFQGHDRGAGGPAGLGAAGGGGGGRGGGRAAAGQGRQELTIAL